MMLKTTFRSNDYKEIERLNRYSTPNQRRTFGWLLIIALLGILALGLFGVYPEAKKTQVGKPVVMEER